MSEIPRISPTEGLITRQSIDILASCVYSFQSGSYPVFETLTYDGDLENQLSYTPALEVRLIQGYKNGDWVEFSIGTISDPQDVYLDTQNSKLIWQSGNAPDINTNFNVWYRYQSSSSDMRGESPGSKLRLIIESFGYELQYAYEFMKEIYYSGFIDYAKGLSLDYLCAIVLGQPYTYEDGTATPRKQATISEGEVTFYGAEGTTIPSSVRVGTTEDSPRYFVMKTPTNQDIPIGSDSITLTFISEDTGRDQNVSVGYINQLYSSPISGLTSLTNNATFSGGTDLETDDDLRERAKNAFQTQGKSSLGAIKYAVMAISGIADCIVNDYMTIRSMERGTISIMVVGETLPIDQSSTLWNTVIDTVNNTRGAGTVPLISQPFLIGISLDCLLDSDTFELTKGQIQTAITNYFASFSPGQDILYHKIHHCIRNIANINDFIINYILHSNTGNYGIGDYSGVDPTPDFAKEWWNSGIDNDSELNTQTITISDTEYFAQVFSPTNEWLSGITLFRKGQASSVGGNRIIEIWNVDGSDIPQQKIGGSSTYGQIIVSESDWEDSDYENNVKNLKFSEPVRLDPSNDYAIVIYKTGSTDDTTLMDATDSTNKTWASTDSGSSWGSDINTHDLMFVLHFSGKYKSAQSFNFRTKVVKYEHRTITTNNGDGTWTIDPVSDTKTPVNTNGFLGIFKAIDLDGDGTKESPDVYDIENYGLRTNSVISSDGEVTLGDADNDEWSVSEEVLISYEYYPYLDKFRGVKLFLREEQLYGNSFDGKVILRIETDNTDKPSGELICYNVVDYCLVYDSSDTGNEWKEETRDINDSGSSDVVVKGGTAGDYFYIGADDQFNAIYFSIGTVSTTGSITVEYYNGSSWEQFEQFDDGTLAFTQNGLMQFSTPENWAKNTIKDIETYWIRIDTQNLTGTVPILNLAYLSFSEKILDSSELSLTTSFQKIYFEFDRAIEILDTTIDSQFWIVLQAVGQKTGRIILKRDNTTGNFVGRSRQYNGTDWTTRDSENVTVVTEEGVDDINGTTLSVVNQSSMSNDAMVIDVMDQSSNDKDSGAESIFHTPGSSGSFDDTTITLPSSFTGNAYVTYLYDTYLDDDNNVDWLFEIIIEKLVNPKGLNRRADLNILIEDQRKLLEFAIIDEINIAEMNE